MIEKLYKNRFSISHNPGYFSGDSFWRQTHRSHCQQQLMLFSNITSGPQHLSVNIDQYSNSVPQFFLSIPVKYLVFASKLYLYLYYIFKFFEFSLSLNTPIRKKKSYFTLAYAVNKTDRICLSLVGYL
jgi:hypothetical protein